jgi:hypothetical protein
MSQTREKNFSLASHPLVAVGTSPPDRNLRHGIAVEFYVACSVGPVLRLIFHAWALGQREKWA